MKTVIAILIVFLLIILAFSGCIDNEKEGKNIVSSVKNLEPIADISTSGTLSSKIDQFKNGDINAVAYEGDIISFDASKSYDPDGEIISYKWFFYDDTTADTISVNHIFDIDSIFTFQGSASKYSISLQVEDDNHSYSYMDYIIGIIPKEYTFYFDSSSLNINKPDERFDSIKATFGKFRPIESLDYIIDGSVYLQKCRWNATIFLEKPLLSFVNMITLSLFNSTGGEIATSTISFKIFEIKKEKQITMSGLISEPAYFKSAQISITGFSFGEKIHILYGNEKSSMLSFDFTDI